MPPQFVFEMRDVTKAFGENVVLRNINLSFFYGAKMARRRKWGRQVDAAENHGRHG